MAAPSLPRGITGPSRADFTSAQQAGQFVGVYPDGSAWVWQTSGLQLAQELNTAVGRPRVPVIYTETLEALRDRMRVAGFDASGVSVTTMDRETLRAALWYTYLLNIPNPGTSPGSRVWLPTALVLPTLGQTITGTATARPDAMRLVPGGGSPSTGGGASTTTTGTSAQRAAALALDTYVRAHLSTVRSNVRDEEVARLQSAMGGLASYDGKYGELTRARMRALGVASPAALTGGGSASTGGTGGTGTGNGTPAPTVVEAGMMSAKGFAMLWLAGSLVGLGIWAAQREQATPARRAPSAPTSSARTASGPVMRKGGAKRTRAGF